MLIFLRVIVACLLGSLVGSLVSCIRSPRTKAKEPAPVVDQAAKPSPAALPFVQAADSASLKNDKEKGVPAPLEPLYRDDAPEHPLYVTGYVLRGSLVNVQLSDGRVLTERDTELAKPARLERNALHLATGQRLFILGRRSEKTSSPGSAEINQHAANGLGVVSPSNVQDTTYPPPPERASPSAPDGVQPPVNPATLVKAR